jgi:hypothetical protein
MLQDTANADVWSSWDVVWRDVRILDRENNLQDVYNLTQNSLGVPANYTTMQNMFLDVARRPQLTPHQAPTEPLNVNNDGCITPLDALLVINDLGKYPNGVLPPVTGELTQFVDVNGNAVVEPLDALLVINQLSNITSCPPVPTAASFAGVVGDSSDMDPGGKNMEVATSAIDSVFAELDSGLSLVSEKSTAAASAGAETMTWARSIKPSASVLSHESSNDKSEQDDAREELLVTVL